MKHLYMATLMLVTTIIGVQAASATQFFHGQCVLINGYLEVVVGPDPAIPGNWLAQDMHRGYAGTTSSWLASQLHPTQCPGPAPAKTSCPPSEPDGDGRSQMEVTVREAIRLEEEGAMTSATVQFKRVMLGQPRNWSNTEQLDFPQGDTSYALLPVEADYVTCSQDATYMYRVERDRDFACFVNATSGELECDQVALVRPDQVFKKVER